MEVEVIEDKVNPLLKRREIRFKVSYQGSTPNRMDLRSKLTAVLNSDKELTVLDRLCEGLRRQGSNEDRA